MLALGSRLVWELMSKPLLYSFRLGDKAYHIATLHHEEKTLR